MNEEQLRKEIDRLEDLAIEMVRTRKADYAKKIEAKLKVLRKRLLQVHDYR